MSAVMTEVLNDSHSFPSLARDVEMITKQSQELYRRSYEYLSRAHVNIGVVSRVSTVISKSMNTDFNDEAEATLKTMYGDIEKKLLDEQARLDVMLTENGINDFAAYSSPKTLKLMIQAPEDNQFIKCLLILDQIIIRIDTLWLGAMITNKEKVTSTMMWKRNLARMANRVINLSNSMRKQIKVINNEPPSSNVSEIKSKNDAISEDEIPTIDVEKEETA